MSTRLQLTPLSSHPTENYVAPSNDDFASQALGREAPTESKLARPLLLAFAGLPLWWVLGLAQIVFFLAAVPMGLYLLRLRRPAFPVGSGTWGLFLVWLLGGALLLQVDAPGATGDFSPGRFLTFAYRFGWYFIGTIAFLYIYNTRHLLSLQRISSAISAMFLVLVAGGLLGMAAPTLEFPSALELLLPGALANNEFVNGLIHPQAAQVQDFLGYATGRPSAPFTYTNEWGLNVLLTAPFFVVSWWHAGGWRRVTMPLFLLLAAFPVVASFNRGVWGGIVALLAFVAIRSALRGKIAILLGVLASATTAFVILLASDLSDLIQSRLETPHSNQGRSNLALQTIESASEGSPLLGFGSTRDVPGNFNSIAGGATDMCPQCSPPPLGTQGHLWLLIFGAGFVGTLLYLWFFATQVLRSIRTTSPHVVAAQCAVIAMLVTLVIYDLSGVGLFTCLLAVGIMAREGPNSRATSAQHAVAYLRRARRPAVTLALIGLALGMAIQIPAGTPASARQEILITEVDLEGRLEGPNEVNLDEEAAIARSDLVHADLQGRLDGSVQHDQTQVSARPNSRVLRLTFTASTMEAARAGLTAYREAYLSRRQFLAANASEIRADSLQAREEALREALGRSLQGVISAETEELGPPVYDPTLRWNETMDQLAQARDGDVGVGEILEGPSVGSSIDPWLVKGAAGLMTGLLVGLLWSATREIGRPAPSRE